MNIAHHGVSEELPDEWWFAAGLLNFIRVASAYRCDHAAAGVRRVCLIPIANIEAQRGPSVPIFKDDPWEGIPGRKRVERILRAFVEDDALPPIELTKQAGRFPFYLQHGMHRLYCSIAAGFTEIPAVKFIDVEALDTGRDIEELC